MRGAFKFTGNIAKTPEKLRVDTGAFPVKSFTEFKEPTNILEPDRNADELKEIADFKPFLQTAKKRSQELESDINDGQFSVRSDDFDDLTTPDLRKVRLNALYLDRNPIGFRLHLTDSVLFAQEIIEKIIRTGKTIIDDNNFLKKLPKHASELCWEMMEAAIDTTIIGGDRETGSFVIDVEPEIPKIDNWQRAKISVEKKPYQEEGVAHLKRELDIKESHSVSSESKLSFNKNIAERAKNITQAAKELIPEIVNLEDFNKEDANEDMLRQRKEAEKRKEQEEKQLEQIRKDEIKKSQQELNKQLKEKKVRNFTYDYDGKIIMVQQPKTDKFGPILYPVSTSIRDPPVENSNDKKLVKKAKRERPPQVTRQKQAPQEEKEFVKALTTTTPLFETFILNPGVTLMHDNKMRAEPRPNTASLANLTEPGLRLSRQDYYSLTRTGNLIRDGISKTATQTLGGTEIRQIASAGDMKKPLDNTFPDENTLEGKPKKGKKANKEAPAPAIIKISSAKIFETLTNTISEMDEIEENMRLKAIQEDERKRTEKKAGEALKSPVDDFNLQIMNARDWGRALHGAGGAIATKQQYPIKANSKQVQRTLGFTFAKKPRDRISQQETVKTNLKFLPPPMVGKTLGHGLYAGVMTDLNLPEPNEE